jgi:hypothetical protein
VREIFQTKLPFGSGKFSDPQLLKLAQQKGEVLGFKTDFSASNQRGWLDDDTILNPISAIDFSVNRHTTDPNVAEERMELTGYEYFFNDACKLSYNTSKPVNATAAP